MFILNSIFWILALYGLFEIIKNIIYIYTYTKFKSEGTYIIIASKNQENIIEYFLRTILFKLIYGKDELVKNIIVTDLNSTDDTMKILSKLSKEYNYVEFNKWKDCRDILDSINNSK